MVAVEESEEPTSPRSPHSTSQPAVVCTTPSCASPTQSAATRPQPPCRYPALPQRFTSTISFDERLLGVIHQRAPAAPDPAPDG
jgi:hypothetical protein